jgi:hypothetical protein
MREWRAFPFVIVVVFSSFFNPCAAEAASLVKNADPEDKDKPGLHGRLDVTPSNPQPAGSKVRVEFKVTLGRDGLSPGGKVVLRWDNWRTAREFRLRNVDATSDRETSSFETTIPPVRKTWPPDRTPIACVLELVEGEPLEDGDHIVIPADVTYSKHSNVAAPLSGHVAASANSALRPLHGSFNFQSKSGPVAEIRVVAQARPAVASTGRVTVAVTDTYGNPVEDFRGTIRLDCDHFVNLVKPYTFTDDDDGAHDFALRFPENVVSRVRASWNDIDGMSNPILPRQPDEPGIYFGDIHSHCEISADGAGDPELAYNYARRFHGLDFAALTDHSPRGAAWEKCVQVGNRFNQDGRFVTFLGFEWSDPVHGHRNAYYRGDTGPAQPVGMSDNMTSWWNFFDQQGLRVFTIPHHPNTQAAQIREDGTPAWGPMDWSTINSKYQRVVEICQGRGSFEAPDGPIPELRIVREDVGASVQTALAKGHRLGFIGSTDTHGGRPGTGPARCAIVSHDFSRRALWDAMYARSCYATSGQHILLFFELNGRPMGSEIGSSDAGRIRTVSWRVIGTAPLKRVDLLRNNKVIESWPGNRLNDLSKTYTTESSSDKCEWWYLRAIQEDTEMAWSSPIWVNSCHVK